MELNPPYQTIQMILLEKSELSLYLTFNLKQISKLGKSRIQFLAIYAEQFKLLRFLLKMVNNLKIQIFTKNDQIFKKLNSTRMLEVNKQSRSCVNSLKQQKVQMNLEKIRNLIKEALMQLKKSQRVSTDNSDSSYTHSAEFIHRMSIDLHAQKTQIMLESLQKGYVMVKHSHNAKSKQKYIYISDDRRFLCWKGLQKNDQKRIQLRKINLVLRGQQQTMCYTTRKLPESLDTYLIIKSQMRNLQLQALNLEQSMKFQIQIDQAIKNAKSIHLSYQL